MEVTLMSSESRANSCLAVKFTAGYYFALLFFSFAQVAVVNYYYGSFLPPGRVITILALSVVWVFLGIQLIFEALKRKGVFWFLISAAVWLLVDWVVLVVFCVYGGITAFLSGSPLW